MSGRGIKFRAWVECNLDNVPSYMNHNPEFHGEINGIFERSGAEPKVSYGSRITYLQFTSLKDCKRTNEYPEGKEVYEGDVVRGTNRISEDVILQKVTFLNGCFMFGNWNAHEYFNKHQFIEVVGNIYEHPELMGGKG